MSCTIQPARNLDLSKGVSMTPYHQLKADTTRIPVSQRSYLERHNAAIRSPRAFESPIIRLYMAIERYCADHAARYHSPVGEDAVLGDSVKCLAMALNGLLDGETGRLDAGTVHSAINRLMREHALGESET